MKNSKLPTGPNPVVLRPWQQSVIDAIEGHETQRDSEQYQGLSDYAINRDLGIFVSHPKGAGHTYLASYIASQYPSVLIYQKLEHFNELSSQFKFNAGTDHISMFEIYYAMHKPDVMTPSRDFVELRKRFEGKKVVVIDNAMSLNSEIRDFIYSVSEGIVIQLGH